MVSRFKAFSAPKEWRFIDPDTNLKYVENDKQSLINRVKAYRKQNNLPDIQAVDVVIENYLCSQPENAGLCEKIQLQRGWLAYLKGGVALLTKLYYGEENMVDQPTAEERAHQCARCSLNVFPDKDQFIAWSDSVAESMVGDRRVSIHDKLGNCAGCSCPLRAKVWWKGKIKLTPIESATMGNATNNECWQLKSPK